MGSGIEWTDETWNPVLGCTHVSEGCNHCYAAREASGRLSGHPLYEGLAVGGKFTGKVRLVPERLDQPLRWRRPRRIFVNSMSDLFHSEVPAEFIAEVFGVMSTARQHQFQVLTKRPGRMASLLNDEEFWKEARRVHNRRSGTWFGRPYLRNVWLGTSVENQKWAEVRIPKLLGTPAAVRFLSCEPLLGGLDLSPWLADVVTCPTCAGSMSVPAPGGGKACPDCFEDPYGQGRRTIRHIDWVIVGGESGPNARPMHPNWARSLRDQCQEAAIAFSFKQWGEWIQVGPDRATHLLRTDGQLIPIESGTRTVPVGSHGERTEDLVDRGHPGWVRVHRPGKKLAGRELAGRTWDEYPEELVPA